MSEHLKSAESLPKSNAELERLAAEKLTRRRLLPERYNRGEAVEQAREQLKATEQVRPAAEAAPKAEPQAPRGILTQAANYRHTMISLRHRMKPAARSFSKLIHAPVVEQVSEVAGKTVFRPSVTTGATTTAVLFAGFVYFYARSYGFLLHGSEIWLSLVIGGAIGLLLEGVSKLARRSRA